MKISEIITEDITRRGILKGIAGAATGGAAINANANAGVRQIIVALARSNPQSAREALEQLAKTNPRLASEIGFELGLTRPVNGGGLEMGLMMGIGIATDDGTYPYNFPPSPPLKITNELISYLSNTEEIKNPVNPPEGYHKATMICVAGNVDTLWSFATHPPGGSGSVFVKTNDERDSLRATLEIQSPNFRPTDFQLANPTMTDKFVKKIFGPTNFRRVDILITIKDRDLWRKVIRNPQSVKLDRHYGPIDSTPFYWKIANSDMSFQQARPGTAMMAAMKKIHNLLERGKILPDAPIRESVDQSNERTTLGDLATIKTNFPDADFWVIRKGSEDRVGMPTKDFSPEHIGVKVTATDVLLPDYLFYVFQYLVQRGYFRDVARGTLRLKNIQISDVSKIPLGVKRKPKPTPNYGFKDTGYTMNEPRFKE